MAHRVMVSASTQKENVGVGQYGTEQDRMMFLADRVKYWLETQKGQFNVIRNEKGMTLAQTVELCNNMACELFIDNHSNAADDTSTGGTEDYYYGQGGTNTNSYKIAKLLYDRVAPISPGKDRGIMPDTTLYKSGLYVVQHTNPPACLIEHMFHTNPVEVIDMIEHADNYAKAEAMAICDYFGIQWIEANTSSGGIHVVVNGIDIDDKMDVKASMVNGRVVVPARFLAEALGAEVSWNADTKTITVTKK